MSVRSNAVVPANEGSFAQYLTHTLVADLQAAGLYDAAASTEITGLLTESILDVPMDTGQASLAPAS